MQLVVVYALVRTVVHTHRAATGVFTRGSTLYKLDPPESIKRSRRANQSMTPVRSYQLLAS